MSRKNRNAYGSGGAPVPPPAPSPTGNQQGNGHGAGPSQRDLDAVRDFIVNEAMTRTQLLRQMLDPRRDIFKECGYPKTQELRPQDYYDLYDREPVAKRAVRLLPSECWQVQPTVYDKEEETKSPFEKAFDALGKGLRGEKSYYKDQYGNPIWTYLKRLHILSRIGRYGVLLFGFDDTRTGSNRTLQSPVEGMEELGTVPGEAGADIYGDVYTFNAKPTKGRKLLYLRAFPETLAPITRYETNRNSPRYGQPVEYQLTLTDPNRSAGGIGAPQATVLVHWTRILHLPSDEMESSEVFGVPTLHTCLNPVQDIQKVRGGSAEGYWKFSAPGIAFETHPQMGGNVRVDEQKMREAYEAWWNGLQRGLIGQGGAFKMLSPSVQTPKDWIDVLTEAVCILLGVPVRIFKGSERGELASSQDDGQWNDRLREHQYNHITPNIIIPFVDRLIQAGVLPEPEGATGTEEDADAEDPPGFCVEWPDLDAQTAGEAADVAVKRTQALAAYVSGGCDAVVPPFEFLTLWLGLDEDEATAIIEKAQAAVSDGESDTGGAPLLGLVGGITGMIELYKAAQGGAMSEDQLRAVIKLFYKVDDDTLDGLIADGLAAPPITQPGAVPGAGGTFPKGDGRARLTNPNQPRKGPAPLPTAQPAQGQAPAKPTGNERPKVVRKEYEHFPPDGSPPFRSVVTERVVE